MRSVPEDYKCFPTGKFVKKLPRPVWIGAMISGLPLNSCTVNALQAISTCQCVPSVCMWRFLRHQAEEQRALALGVAFRTHLSSALATVPSVAAFIPDELVCHQRPLRGYAIEAALGRP